MQLAEVQELVGWVASVDPCCCDREVLTGAVASVGRLQSWVEGQRVRLARQLADVASFPEKTLANAARGSLRDAERDLERGRTIDAMPAVGAALAAGDVSGGHVDVVTRALRQLEAPQRKTLTGHGARWAEIAKAVSPEELARTLRCEVRRILADDGVARLEGQKRATRLWSFVDRDGMWCLTGRFDPETGVKLSGRLDQALAALFTDQVPDGCPSDPLERRHFLTAHTLVALTAGTAPGSGRPEVLVVVDVAHPDPAVPAVDWRLPVELPDDVLVKLFPAATVTPVVVNGGTVLHAPGELDLGRTTRLANRAQRRSLRALYRTCAVPGCDVCFDPCRIHHIVSWDQGGTTDLVNLVPLCWKHHHAVHDLGWILTLLPDRRLRIDHPDGTHTLGPPPRGHHHDPSAP